jgi:hypothetical protein
MTIRPLPPLPIERKIKRVPINGLREFDGGVIYFVDSAEFTKIGWTLRRVNKRIAGMQSSNPFPLRLWALLRGDEVREQAIHAMFAAQRHYVGEWFRFRDGEKAILRSWIRDMDGEVYS